MEFQVLGPFEVRREGGPVPLGPAKQRTLLAILLVRANEIVSSDRLTEELWPEPPDTAGNALQVYVHKLRKALEPDRRRGESGELLITRAPGYMLCVEPGQLDAGRFARLLGDGKAAAEAGDQATAARTLAQALELWRGPAYADFAYDPFAQAEIARLEELRLDAMEARIEADLALGGAAELVGELETLIGDNPLRERLRGQLMLALYRAGRQADALEAYDEARRTLDEELGLAPSPSLQRLQTDILRQAPALEVSIDVPDRPADLAASSAAQPEVAAATEVRKTVTVLIARRPSARGVDPEALSRDDKRYRDHLARTVDRHGGTIASTLGDEVMAVFGVPRSHEDDAVRAVSAALEIRDAPAQDATVAGAAPRIGVASGEALVSGSGSGPPTFVGEPVTAARELQDAAAAGEILIGEETERLVHGPAAVETVDTEAGPAWRVRELRHERPAVGSLTAPMVGRGIELGRLRDAFEQVTGERSLRLFTILGTAGIGKSRLAQEFAGEADGQATVVVGRCVPYGEGITFWSLREIVGQLTADRLVGDGHEAGPIADELRNAIGVTGASVEREEIFWATRSLFTALARDRPLVVFFEDVHWAEPTFLDLVEYLAQTAEEAPIFLVCIARPELLEQRPEWTRERPNAGSLELERLPDAECQALIGNLAGGLAPETRARVLETAEGNPLFIEQLVAMIAEARGTDGDLSIPPTIDALLSARLDRLGPGERAVISRAAIVGKEFSAEATVDLLPEDAREFGERHLETLSRKEFIRDTPTALGAGFRFRHILIQQAAYRATPKSLRAELHERFADWVDDPARSGVDESSDVVGYHLEQAFEYRSELGPVGEQELALAHRAGDHLATAGHQAFKRGDMPATVNLLGRAVALPTPRGGPGLAALPELGYALFEIGEVDEASAVLAGGRERARADGDRGIEWRVTITRPRVEMYRDPEGIDLDAIAVETETAVEALRELGDEAGMARALMVLSDIHWSKGRLREASDTATQAADYARRVGNRREVGWALGQNALCAINGPLPVAEGLEWLERLLAAEPENRTLDANLSGFVTVLEAMSGRFELARRHIADTRALASDLGLRWQGAVQELLSGYVELLAGDPVVAERDMRAADRAFREIGEGWFLSTVAVDLPRAVYEQGRYDDAFALLGAIDENPAPTDSEWLIKRTGVPARVLARRGRFEEAERLAREGVAVAANCEFVVLHADVLLDLAEVLRLAGRPDEAEAATAEAVNIYERKGNVAAAERARALAETR